MTPSFELNLCIDCINNSGQVSGNCDGNKETMLDQIFVPFFTTKKEGSGIGLSQGRQIILLHHGSINVSSQLGKGTVFTIKL